MDKKISSKEMEKIVREAGMFEENMSKDDIENYYKAITNSKDTATTENERNFNNNDDNKINKTTNIKVIAKKESQKSSDRNLIEEQDATKSNIGFNDMHKSNEEPFQILPHFMKFFNIQRNESFLDADNNMKTIMLYSYHTKIGKLQSKLSRESFFSASMPKPIMIREALTNNDGDYEFKDTYISRSGRQTKRKIYYNDDEDSLDFDYNKKQKGMEEMNKIPKAKSLNKVDLKKPDNLQDDMDNKETSDEFKSKESTPKITTKRNKLTNSEIMERSTLFSNSTSKTKQTHMPSDTPRKRGTRCELMFDKLRGESEKKLKEEKLFREFEKTLEVTDEVGDIQSEQENTDKIGVSEEVPLQSRIVSSVGRKSIHDKNNQAPIHFTERKGSNLNENRNGDNTISSKNTTKNAANTDECPICGVMFDLAEIMEHASTCGEVETPPMYSDNNQLTSPRYSDKNQLTCNICEQVILKNYDVHVRECIDRQEELNSEK